MGFVDNHWYLAVSEGMSVKKILYGYLDSKGGINDENSIY